MTPPSLSRRGRRRAGSPPIEYSLLLTATLCLLAFGAVMVFSASSTTSLLGETGDGAFYLKRTLLFGALGLVAMKLLSVRGVSLVRTLTPPILAVAIGLLVVVHLPGVGIEANGARRWIGTGLFQIQPSEVAKLALVLYGAHLLATRPRTVRDLPSMGPFLAVVGLACILIVFQPDLGTAIVAALAIAALLVVAGARVRDLGVVCVAVAGFALLTIAIEPYRMERVTSFLDPGADATGSGFQGVQASIALGSGGILGVGLGESVQKAFYLPEAHTDMIAAVIGEELGLAGITVLVGLFALFAYAGFRTAQRARDRYTKLLAAGITAMVMVQAVVNLFAVLGLAPLTGIPLPFVSYGNSNLMVMLAGVGLLLNIAAGRAPAGRRSGTKSGGARLRVVEGGRSGRTAGAKKRRSTRSGGTSRDSRGGNRRARGAGARRRRRAAG